MASPLGDNPDLAWDLNEILNRERAMDFVLQFETTLCVYSASVEQLYSTYNLFFPEEFRRKMVILPDPAAYHDTFHNVPVSSVMATGLHIIPGELIDKRGLFLANVNRDRTLGNRQLPFGPAVRSIMQRRSADDPFLPVLAKGDLREFNDSWPVLHLHRIKISELTEHSALDRTNITNTITEKLDALLAELGTPPR